jgi:hypothetical protein
MRARGRTSLLLIAAALALAAVPASALGGPAADADPYALTAVALLGNEGTDVYLTVSSSTADVPDRIDKIQVKARPFDGDPLQTRNYFDLRRRAASQSFMSAISPGTVRSSSSPT